MGREKREPCANPNKALNCGFAEDGGACRDTSVGTCDKNVVVLPAGFASRRPTFVTMVTPGAWGAGREVAPRPRLLYALAEEVCHV